MDPDRVDKEKTRFGLRWRETVLLLIFFDLIARRRLGLAPVGDLHPSDPVNTSRTKKSSPFEILSDDLAKRTDEHHQ